MHVPRCPANFFIVSETNVSGVLRQNSHTLKYLMVFEQNHRHVASYVHLQKMINYTQSTHTENESKSRDYMRKHFK